MTAPKETTQNAAESFDPDVDDFGYELECTHCAGEGTCDDNANPLWDCDDNLHARAIRAAARASGGINVSSERNRSHAASTSDRASLFPLNDRRGL